MPANSAFKLPNPSKAVLNLDMAKVREHNLVLEATQALQLNATLGGPTMNQPADIRPEEVQALARMNKVDYAKVLDPLVEEFKDLSDRAAVIIGAAHLDNLLIDLLAKFFLRGYKPEKSRDGDNLVGRNGPLHAFSGRISAANRLGLIGDQFAKSLDTVRDIRNEFAHQIGLRTLDSNSYRDRISNLNTELIPSPTFWKIAVQKFGPDNPGNRLRAFISTAVVVLRADIENVKPATPQPLLGTTFESPPKNGRTKLAKRKQPASQPSVAATGAKPRRGPR